jgi:3-phenylpropionate/trans-cinnamate dioxygenase ferredoxin reductase subunit
MTRQTFAIVGASLTGAKAAEELRSEGFDGRLLLIGDEPELPYERPPLTKDYLRGESPREKAFVHPDGFYAEHEIELLTETGVTAIEPGRSRVSLQDGSELSYDRLLIATGAAPRRISIPGADLDGVCYLRTLADCDVLRDRLQRSGRVAVVGAGWIGAEFAASARQLGNEVTVIEPSAVPLERVLGAEIGGVYRDVHREHGVELLLGTGVDAFEGDASVRRVRTSDGNAVDCDFVVVGVGVAPRVALAEAAGLGTDNGILVDQSLATSAPAVFAAGDVANAWHPFYDRRIRVEHWANALNQGPAAARAMLGAAIVYDRIPYFYSDQYEIGMEYRGYAADWDEVLVRGDSASREFIAFWLKGGTILAGMNVNVWDAGDQIQALVQARAKVDSRRLSDPDTPLDQIAPAPGHETNVQKTS